MKLSGAGHLDEVQQGSQDCPLWGPGRNWGWSRRLTLNQSLLASVGKEAFYPLQEVSSNSIIMQFDCEALMTDLIESFTEIENIYQSVHFPPWLKLGLAQLGSAGSRTNASS